MCYGMKSLGAACVKLTQDVRSLEDNKLIQVQPAARFDHSGLAGLFERPHFWGPICGEFQLDLLDVPPLATIPKVMIVSIINSKIISLNVA